MRGFDVRKSLLIGSGCPGATVDFFHGGGGIDGGSDARSGVVLTRRTSSQLEEENQRLKREIKALLEDKQKLNDTITKGQLYLDNVLKETVKLQNMVSY